MQACWREYRKARLPSPEDIGKPQSMPMLKPDPLAWAAPLSSGQIEVLGLLTLEDVIEEFMGDIKDETDLADREALNVRPGDRAKRVSSQALMHSSHKTHEGKGMKSPYNHIPRLRHHPPSAGLGSSVKFISRLAHVKSGASIPGELTSGSAGTLTPLGESTPLLTGQQSGRLSTRYQSCNLNSSIGRYE